MKKYSCKGNMQRSRNNAAQIPAVYDSMAVFTNEMTIGSKVVWNYQLSPSCICPHGITHTAENL